MSVCESRLPRAGVHATSVSNAADFVAPTLILLAPFLHFIEYHDYRLLSLECLLILLPLLVIGLLVSVAIRGASHIVRVLLISAVFVVFLNLRGVYGFFEWMIGCAILAWFLREHLTTILSVGFAVMIVTTYLLPPYNGATREEFSKLPPTAAQEALPPIVHLVLDEHIGIEGIPQDSDLGRAVKTELKSFYEQHGFRLYGGAYSQYFKTYDSLSNMFNFSSASTNSRYFPEGVSEEPYLMSENRYFAALAERGYRFRVYQSHYMNFCNVPDLEYLSCTRYGNTIKAIESLDMPATQKSLFILNSFLRSSSTARYLLRRYRDLRIFLAGQGVELSAWDRRYRVGLLALPPVMQQLQDDLRDNAGGTVFFAHLLLPHYPYVFEPDCSVSDRLSEWMARRSDHVARPLNNTHASRDARYARYLVQVRCQQKMLAEVFQTMRAAGLFDEATLVLQGDHGSRISIHDPLAKMRNEVSSDDIVAHFSTLYAIKDPQIESGYTPRLEPLQNLLATFMEQKPPVADNYVYLLDKRHGEMQKHAINEAMWVH